MTGDESAHIPAHQDNGFVREMAVNLQWKQYKHIVHV